MAIGTTIALIKALGGNGSGSDGGSSGGGLLVPVYTMSAEPDQYGIFECTCDKTYAEIKAAIDAGQCFFAKSVLEYEGDTTVMYFSIKELISESSNSENYEYISWYFTDVNSQQGVMAGIIEHNSDEYANFYTNSYIADNDDK